MNEKPRSYRDLLVWQKGISLAKPLYSVTSRFPSEEKFGLISQIRRAAVSVPSNIAEGQARHTSGEFVRFIANAEGSIAELDTQLILSQELGFVSSEDIAPCLDLVQELKRMLNSLRRRIAARADAST